MIFAEGPVNDGIEAIIKFRNEVWFEKKSFFGLDVWRVLRETIFGVFIVERAHCLIMTRSAVVVPETVWSCKILACRADNIEETLSYTLPRWHESKTKKQGSKPGMDMTTSQLS